MAYGAAQNEARVRFHTEAAVNTPTSYMSSVPTCLHFATFRKTFHQPSRCVTLRYALPHQVRGVARRGAARELLQFGRFPRNIDVIELVLASFDDFFL
jgi:hypothetical protein